MKYLIPLSLAIVLASCTLLKQEEPQPQTFPLNELVLANGPSAEPRDALPAHPEKTYIWINRNLNPTPVTAERINMQDEWTILAIDKISWTR